MEALGRSQAIPAMTRNVMDTFGGLARLEHAQNQEARAQQLFPEQLKQTQQQTALTGIQMQQAQNSLEEQKKQKERNEQVIDVTTHPLYLQLSPQGQKNTLDFYSKMGLTDPTGKGKAENIMYGLQLVENTSKLFKELMVPEVEFKRTNVLNAYNEWQESMKGNNEKKSAELKAKYDQLNMSYQIANNGFEKHFQVLQNRDIIDKNIKDMGINFDTLPQSAQLALKNTRDAGDIAENTKVLMGIKQIQEKAPTKTEVLMGVKGTKQQRKDLIEGLRQGTSEKPSTYAEKRASAIKIAKERSKGAPITEEQVANIYKEKYGATDFLAQLLGTNPTDPLGLKK